VQKLSIFRSAAAAAMALALAATGAQATQLVSNGDFATGDFTGWTLFTTTNGTAGFNPGPQVTAFDVTGNGASNAAEFQVGQINASALWEGGGIFQTLNAAAGLLTFSADFASYLSQDINLSGGVFSVLLDGVVLDSFDTGEIAAGFSGPIRGSRVPVPAIERGTLTFSTDVTAGSHILALQVTRPYPIGGGATPLQYFDNISATQADALAVPEPATWGLMILGFGLAGSSLRRRARPAARAA
jgi:PEP-CTERM motif